MNPQELTEILESEDLPRILKNISKPDFSSQFPQLPREIQTKAIERMKPYFRNYDLLNQSIDKLYSYTQEDQSKVLGVAYEVLVQVKPAKKKSKSQ